MGYEDEEFKKKMEHKFKLMDQIEKDLDGEETDFEKSFYHLIDHPEDDPLFEKRYMKERDMNHGI